MNSVVIRLAGNPLEAVVQKCPAVIGSQFDNYAAKFVFERPPEFVLDSLLLYFSDGKTNSEPINIGTKNEFEISNHFTQRTILNMQIAFERNEIIIYRSNVCKFF